MEERDDLDHRLDVANQKLGLAKKENRELQEGYSLAMETLEVSQQEAQAATQYLEELKRMRAETYEAQRKQVALNRQARAYVPPPCAEHSHCLPPCL